MSNEPIVNLIGVMRTVLSTGEYLLGVVDPEQHPENSLVPYFFLRKTVRLLGAIDTLISSGFEEEAQVLVRALIETRINFEYFLILAQQSPKKALARVIHAKMLEKLKTLKATDFKIGESAVDKAKWEQIEREIKSCYTNEEVERLKKYGFSGMSLEARAVKTGNKELYDLAYRLYSGHAHATDFHEQVRSVLLPEWASEVEETLLPAVLEAATDCARVVVRRCNEWLGNPLDV